MRLDLLQPSLGGVRSYASLLLQSKIGVQTIPPCLEVAFKQLQSLIELVHLEFGGGYRVLGNLSVGLGADQLVR
ncbi:MAG: hypothetical protein GTO63_36110 [Anaerolineae bacterium]|nr:hypothetical protein [Anaerolineae bacterium]